MKPKDRTAPAVLLIGAALILLSVISLLSILLPKNRTDGLIADIYRNGELIASIPFGRGPGKLTVLRSRERKDM